MKKDNLEFIDLKYKPDNKDLVCLFKIKPSKNLSFQKAANIVALESSIGTWTEVIGSKQEYVKEIRAKVFSINPKSRYIKIAYPQELFEYDNIPNILSSIAGNIFGMKAVESIRLEDVSFPASIIRSFKGPRYGVKGVRKIMNVKNRPFVGTIIKPKLGLKTKDHAQSAYNSWIGGCDIVKDDENLSSQKFNLFENRLAKTLEMQDIAERETGERKTYLVNVTAETKEMMKRAQLAENMGSKHMMVDIITSGWSSVQTLCESGFKPAIHAHRAMHAAFDRNPEHGMSMMVLADFARLAGVDQLHTGTGIGKLEGKIEDIKELDEEIELSQVKQTHKRLQQNWGKIKGVLAVASGGLHPGHIPFLINHLGKDLIIQAGGGVHGHPDGSIAGAKAMRQAVEATLKKKTLKQYSKDHVELRRALELWGIPKQK